MRCAGNSPAGIRASGSLLSQVQTTFQWALYDREPLPTWTKGRLTLLGDAAHPMLPHLGQGANQSIEDGMALATILSRADRENAPAALLAYERLRRERVARCSAARARTASRDHLPTPISACATPRSPPMPRSARRLYDHDVVPEAQTAATTLTRTGSEGLAVQD